MKPANATFLLPGFFYKLPTLISKPFHFSLFIISVLLLTTSVTVAGERGISPGNSRTNPDGSFAGAGSPLSGTESMRTNLYLLNNNNTTILADGVLTEYNNLYHDSVMLEDAYKFTNINENLGLRRHGKTLAVERRPIITTLDTVFLQLWRTTRRNYQLEFVTTKLDHPGMDAFLEDAFLKMRTPLSLSGITKINFSITSDSASANINRFKIVYQAGSFIGSTLPVTFTSVKGYGLKSNISIDWKVENELNIERYEIERSANGTEFVKINAVSAGAAANKSGSYSWVDHTPASGINFYRIKSIDKDGSKIVSPIIRVGAAKANAGGITIYPNPIKGNRVNLQFTNQPTGVYQVRMSSNSGQLVYSGRLAIYNNNVSQAIYTNKKLAGGLYQLEIKTPDNSIHVQQALVQE